MVNDIARPLAGREPTLAVSATLRETSMRGRTSRQSLDPNMARRAWMFRMLAEIGAIAVQIEEQKIEGYALGPNRFNVFARP